MRRTAIMELSPVAAVVVVAICTSSSERSSSWHNGMVGCFVMVAMMIQLITWWLKERGAPNWTTVRGRKLERVVSVGTSTDCRVVLLNDPMQLVSERHIPTGTLVNQRATPCGIIPMISRVLHPLKVAFQL
jgi:hypothetical protein